VDIIPIISKVVAAYMDPVKLTEKALDALIATTFINDVDLPTLGLLVPVLTKGTTNLFLSFWRFLCVLCDVFVLIKL